MKEILYLEEHFFPSRNEIKSAEVTVFDVFLLIIQSTINRKLRKIEANGLYHYFCYNFVLKLVIYFCQLDSDVRN